MNRFRKSAGMSHYKLHGCLGFSIQELEKPPPPAPAPLQIEAVCKQSTNHKKSSKKLGKLYRTRGKEQTMTLRL